MLVAVLFICPIGVAALFAFALVADRHFKDSPVDAHGHFPESRRPMVRPRQATSDELRF
ncbi:hypothetical protein [Caballeronia pedi]|uniref:hypothetical protein n=1 Tax=Caballeronia pedi TaxID=1777141 RepID=UPI0013578699|nr:hypothetical protein [Caballeronia pedi]